MKRAILLGMTAFFVLGWGVTVQRLIEKPAKYRQLIQAAEHYESEKIYVKAIEAYKAAQAFKPDSVDLECKVALNYLALGNEASFINCCNSINEGHHYPMRIVTVLADYYMDSKRNEKAIALLKKAMKYHKNNPELTERYEKLRYTYQDLYLSYDEILQFRNGSAVVIQDGRYGLIDKNGKTVVKCQNDWMGVFSNDRSTIPVCNDGEFYFINSSGYRVEVPLKGQRVEELGVICNGAAPARLNGGYGYIDEKFHELTPFFWDGATVIQNGFGAVCKAGKWALTDNRFSLITDYIYDDVKTDPYGYCSISGRAFVKTRDGYRLVNEKGNTVGELAFRDAEPFQTEQPAPVKLGEKWGFINLEGRLVIEPQYENAGAFSSGLAPVQTLNGWGYINMENQLVISDSFMEARAFYKGAAPVKKDGYWTVIELNVKE